MMQKTTLFVAALYCLFCSALQAAEFKSSATDRQELSLTVYNAGRALVRDQRSFDLAQPVEHIAFSDVSQQIMAQTVAIDGLRVLEQNYDFDLLSPQALISKHVGKKVKIARRAEDTGETLEWRSGTILSANGGVILRMDDGNLELLERNRYYHMVFEEIPDNLRASPTLTLRLAEAASGQQSVRMTYLTGGLSWQSDYVLQLDGDEKNASLDSWITLNNQSGISYSDARVQLLAGDVNTVAPGREQMLMADTMMTRQSSATEVTEQALHGYHLYSVPFPTTLRDNQSKQIKLFSAHEIPLTRALRDRAWVNQNGGPEQKSKPEQILIINNRKPALGIPLPQGTVRVYGRDEQGQNQFLGEDRINHSAVNEELELGIGKAFDVSVKRNTRDILRLSKKQTQLTRELVINNGAETQQIVELYELLPVTDWQVLSSSHAQEKTNARELRFKVEVPALQKVTVRYRVEIRQP